MRDFRTAEGDRIRVEWDGGTLADDLALAVSPESDEAAVDGVLTTAAHADAVHRLFDRGERFRIAVDPAGDGAPVAYAGCVLLSSSGKWTARAVERTGDS